MKHDEEMNAEPEELVGKALAIRMKQLGLLDEEYLENPFDYLTVFPEVARYDTIGTESDRQM